MESAPSPPFEAPLIPLDQTAQFSGAPLPRHRIRTRGTVSAALPGNAAFLQAHAGGLRVQASAAGDMQPGDVVEVAGFLDMSRQIAGLTEAVARRTGREPAPEPRPITPDEIATINITARRRGEIATPGDFDGCLVTFPARVVEVKPSASDVTVLRAAEELRGSVWALRTMPVAGKSFGESLEAIARQTSHGHAEHIAVRTSGTPFELPQFVAGNLLLVAQEAIHNALAHADAGQIDVAADFDAARGSVELTVVDDGHGFTPATASGPDQGHFGLSGMRERIERLGGTLSIDSQPGKGTTIHGAVQKRDYDLRIEATDDPVPAAIRRRAIDSCARVSHRLFGPP